MIQKGVKIEAPSGKLGVLIPGMGAVSTTFMAGVEAVKKGIAKPTGSLTQLGTIRLGKRTEKRTPLIKDFIPLAGIEDLVFGGWDIYNDNCFESAVKAGVLERHCWTQVRPEIEKGKTDESRLPPGLCEASERTQRQKGEQDGPAEQLMSDIDKFKADHNLTRVVMVWCGSTEIYMKVEATHATLETFEQAMRDNDPTIAPSMIYAYAALKKGIPFANGAPNLTVDVPALTKLAIDNGVPICGKDFKTGQTLMKTILAPGLKSRMLGLSGWFPPTSWAIATEKCWMTRSRSRQRKRASSPCSTRFSSRSFTRISMGISTTRSDSLLPSTRRQ